MKHLKIRNITKPSSYILKQYLSMAINLVTIQIELFVILTLGNMVNQGRIHCILLGLRRILPRDGGERAWLRLSY